MFGKLTATTSIETVFKRNPHEECSKCQRVEAPCATAMIYVVTMVPLSPPQVIALVSIVTAAATLNTVM